MSIRGHSIGRVFGLYLEISGSNLCAATSRLRVQDSFDVKREWPLSNRFVITKKNERSTIISKTWQAMQCGDCHNVTEFTPTALKKKYSIEYSWFIVSAMGKVQLEIV